jgi:hypothetical protein
MLNKKDCMGIKILLLAVLCFSLIVTIASATTFATTYIEADKNAVLLGGTFTFQGWGNPVDRLHLRIGDSEDITLPKDYQGRWSYTWTPQRAGNYKIELLDSDSSESDFLWVSVENPITQVVSSDTAQDLTNPTSNSLPPSDSFNPMIIYGGILLLCIGGGGYYVLHSRKSGSPPSQDIGTPAQNPSVPTDIPRVSSGPFKPNVIGEHGIDINKLPREIKDKLEQISINLGRPVIVISGKRGHPIPMDRLSAHTYNLAVDIMIPEYNGQPEYNSQQIATELEKVGFNGIGKYHRWDGHWTNTAHGDIRGSLPSSDTPYRSLKAGRWEEWNINPDPDPDNAVWDTYEKWIEKREEWLKTNPVTTQPTPTPPPKTPVTPVTQSPRPDTIQSIPIPTPTPPPQTSVTPVTQSPVTTGSKFNTAVKWIAICCGGALLIVFIGALFIGVIWPYLNTPSKTAEQTCQELAAEKGYQSCGYCAQDQLTSNNPWAGYCRYCSRSATCIGDPCSDIVCSDQQVSSGTTSSVCSNAKPGSGLWQACQINKVGWDTYERGY